MSQFQKALKWAKDNRWTIGAVLTAVGGLIAGEMNAPTAAAAILAALSRARKST